MFLPPLQGLNRTLPTIPGEKGVALQVSALPDGHHHEVELPENGVIPGFALRRGESDPKGFQTPQPQEMRSPGSDPVCRPEKDDTTEHIAIIF